MENMSRLTILYILSCQVRIRDRYKWDTSQGRDRCCSGPVGVRFTFRSGTMGNPEVVAACLKPFKENGYKLDG
jgi:hypothetical protein